MPLYCWDLQPVSLSTRIYLLTPTTRPSAIPLVQRCRYVSSSSWEPYTSRIDSQSMCHSLSSSHVLIILESWLCHLCMCWTLFFTSVYSLQPHLWSLFNMAHATQDAYESILSMYTPLDVKDIITNGASRKAYKHKTENDILSWYAEFNEGLHHNLLDGSESVCTPVSYTHLTLPTTPYV